MAAAASLTSHIVGGDWVAVAYNSNDGQDLVKPAMNFGSIQGETLLK